MRDYILDAAVCLRRNYADLPFDALTNAETARRVNERAMVALERSGESYAYLTTDSLPEEQREALTQKRLLCADNREAVSGNAYLRMDEGVCVETSGEDHLQIAAYDETGDTARCLALSQGVARLLEDTGRMAHSEQFGYLTARPCDAGTGLRASLLLHLPMTAMIKQIAAANKLAGTFGMTLRVINGGICLLENRVTMGKDERGLLDMTAEAAKKLITLERSLRWRAQERKDINIADKAWRAYAVAKYALRVSEKEALQLWSGMTLGVAASMLSCPEETLESLWRIAHTAPGKLTQDTDLQPDVERARRIRALFSGGD